MQCISKRNTTQIYENNWYLKKHDDPKYEKTTTAKFLNKICHYSILLLLVSLYQANHVVLSGMKYSFIFCFKNCPKRLFIYTLKQNGASK